MEMKQKTNEVSNGNINNIEVGLYVTLASSQTL